MHGYLYTFIQLLLVATGVSIVARRWRVPHSTALVIAGAAIGYFRVMPPIHFDSTVILTLFLPILVFGSAIGTDATHLKDNLRPVVLLSTLGTVAITGIIAVLLHAWLGLAWPLAFLLGTMLSITDAVSVLAIFGDLRIPRRLAIIVEAESLLNDGTALVLYRLVLAVALGGQMAISQTIGDFFLVSCGGVAIGATLGYLASQALRQTQDHLVEMLLTTAAALIAYNLAEGLNTSGVMAVLAAGLVVGNYGWKRALSPKSQIALGSYWEFACFGVNSVVFLLLGLSVDLHSVGHYAVPILLAVLAFHAGRVVVVYGGCLLFRAWTKHPLPLRWQHVLFWGNVKGSLTMALALALPAEIPQREMLLAVSFGVVLVSLVTQGVTLGPLIRWLGINKVTDGMARFEDAQVRLVAARAAQENLIQLQRAGVVSQSIFERLEARYQAVVAVAERELRQLGSDYPEHRDSAVEETQLRLIMVEKGAVISARRQGLVTEDAAQRYIEHLDALSVAHSTAMQATPDTPEA